MILERIRRAGPLRFDEFLEEALYGPEGFFTASGRGAGRRADFVTSPELGPLFGAVVARSLDAEWARVGRPDPFVVVEAGAGRGVLAQSILAAAPECRTALRYICVERSPWLRHEAESLLAVEAVASALGPAGAGHPGDEERPAVEASGPVVSVLDDLPAVPLPGVVLANELLDNLPFRLLERQSGGWAEVLVATRDAGDLTGELLVDAPPDAAASAERLAPAARPGARIPLQAAAVDWLRRALGVLERGKVVVFDYADTTSSLAARPWLDWVRTYRSHGRGGDPLEHAGDQDVTCEVARDQLAELRRPSADLPQAEWLRRHGIEELVEMARAAWREQASVGDLSALAARSRVGEADALCDPAGLGAFRVLEWEVSP